MKKTVQFTISEDVIEKFEIALMLNKENSNEVIEGYMKQYISASFSNVSQTYKDSTPIVAINPKNTMNSYTGKAKLRIPK